MKLIRLTSHSNDGIFDNSFTQPIELKPMSKIAFQNIAINLDFDVLLIGNANRTIRYDTGSGNIRTVLLRPFQYRVTNYNEFVINLYNVMNTGLFFQGKELGLQKTNLSIQQNIESLEKKIVGLKSLKGKIDTGNAELNRDINESISGSVESTKQLIAELKETQSISKNVSEDLGVKTFVTVGTLHGTSLEGFGYDDVVHQIENRYK